MIILLKKQHNQYMSNLIDPKIIISKIEKK